MKVVCTLVILLVTALPAVAEIRVVATTSSMAMLVREVGGNAVNITTLAPPDRDPHYLLARPSMMVALRRADLLVAVGAELEVGWLPAAMQGAANPKILPGQPGYFEGAAQIELIEVGEAADRSRGDVHPRGNPHFYMDPLRMVTVARALAVRLGTLDPANQARFASRADAFARVVASRVSAWKRQAVSAPGVVFYHSDGNYLAAFLGVQVLAYIEPLPGISPSASHLRALVSRLSGTRGVIIYNDYHPREGPEFVGRQLGWKTVQLPVDVPLNATGATYLDLIDQWVRAITVVTP